MRVGDFLRVAVQAFLFPQECVICECWLARPDFSTVCDDCLSQLCPLRAPICRICGVDVPGLVEDSYGLCPECRREAPAFDLCRSWGAYEGNLRRLVRRYKFSGMMRLAVPLAERLASLWESEFSSLSFDWIIPVPTHPRRTRARGFDHTLILSKQLSRAIGCRVLCGGVRRVRNTLPLFGLPPAERRRTLKGAFAVKEAERMAHRNVVVVDDILTTGSTVNEVCGLLRNHTSVDRLAVLTVARVPTTRYL